MKKVKFRVYVPSSDEMVYSNDMPDIGFWEYVGPEEILLQYTGLKDKNGVEIYEGDIYQYWHITNEKNKCTAVIDDIREIFLTNEPLYDTHYGYGDFYFYTGEVIGNIYQNPELLEET